MTTTATVTRALTRRMADALKLVANEQAWLRLRDLRTGKCIGYGIPSRSVANLFHRTNTTRCTCRDFTERQAPRGDVCAHVLAARLYVGQATAARAAALPANVVPFPTRLGEVA